MSETSRSCHRWAAIRVLISLLGACILTTSGAASNTVSTLKDYAPGEVLVKYKVADMLAASENHRRWGARTLKVLEAQGVHRVRLPESMSIHEALERLRRDPLVEYAEPNYLRHIQRIPNDSYYSWLWGLQTIDAPAAWNAATDCTTAVVAVIDTGVDYTHPDLEGNIWLNSFEIAGNGLDDDGNGKIDDLHGWDFVFDDNDPMDAYGHGTHVAGTIGAAGDNGRGVAGVCWKAQIMILRAFDASGSATVADTIEAMDYARRMGAKIINASYSSSQFSRAEKDAIEELNSAGILLIAAAGNEGLDADLLPSYPACHDLPNVIAVAASDADDRLASFSNYGAHRVHVAAPGLSVVSAYLEEGTVLDPQDFEAGTAGWNLDAPADRVSPGFDSQWALAHSPAGDYADSVNISVVAPAFSMAGRSGGLLVFFLNGEIIEDGDKLFVETAASAGGPWTKKGVWVFDWEDWSYFPAGIYGNISNWAYAQVDLEDPDVSSTVYTRFRLSTNASGTAGGYMLDDISVSAFTPGQDVYAVGSGTSMAAPHVSGLAALIWSLNPGLTASQVKGRILDCVDRVSSLSGYIVTAGRINAKQALLNIPAEPSGFAAIKASGNRVDLSWDENYFGAISVKIERRESPTAAFAEIATVGPGLSVYRDTNVQAAQTYYYRARAFNDDHPSAYTAEVSVALPAGSSGGGGGGSGCFITTLLGD